MPASVCPQGLGAARVDSGRVVLWRRGVPSALLAVHGPAPQTAALGHRVQEQRVQEHPVSAAGGEVQRHVPAAEGEVQGHGQGKDRGQPGAPFKPSWSYLRRWVLVFDILTRFGPRSQILRSLSTRMSPSLRIFLWVFLKSMIQWWLTLEGWCEPPPPCLVCLFTLISSVSDRRQVYRHVRICCCRRRSFLRVAQVTGVGSGNQSWVNQLECETWPALTNWHVKPEAGESVKVCQQQQVSLQV